MFLSEVARGKFLRLCAILTTIVFTSTSTSWGQIVSPVSPSPVASGQQLHLDQIAIPPELGRIESQLKRGAEAPLVVFVQDAHAILDAQNNIQKILDYLSRQYGIDLVALEGGQGRLDATLFRSFPDEIVKKKVFGQYLERGELSGAEMAALFNSSQTHYHGIENWNLYEENYLAYLRAIQSRDITLNQLKKLEDQLREERGTVFSPRLNDFYKHVDAFNQETSHLLELLKYLSAFAKEQQTTIKDYPQLASLLAYVGSESALPKESLDASVRKLAASFKKRFQNRLSKEAAMKFNGAHQAFLAGQLDAGAFLKILMEVSSPLGVKPRLTPLMEEVLGHAETLSTLRGTKLFEELKGFIERVQGQLITRPKERELVEKQKKLNLLKDLVNLEITREDLESYDADPASFRLLLKDSGQSLEPALEFYRLALERDQTFHKNLKALLQKEKSKAVVVLAGGFHTQGFERMMASEKYSLAVVAPKINSVAGKELYSEVMQGKLSYKQYLKTSFYDAFARHATVNLVNGLSEPDFKKDLKLWRDEVIRELSAEGRITEAREYTRYIDLLFKAYIEKFGEGKSVTSKEEVLKILEKELVSFQDDVVSRTWQRFQLQLGEFTQGLKTLVKNKSLTVENVSRLMERSGQTRSSLLKPATALTLINIETPRLIGAVQGEPLPELVTAGVRMAPRPIPVSVVTRPSARTSLTPREREVLADLKKRELTVEGGAEMVGPFMTSLQEDYPDVPSDKLLELAQRAVLETEGTVNLGDTQIDFGRISESAFAGAGLTSPGKETPQLPPSGTLSPNMPTGDSVVSRLGSPSDLKSIDKPNHIEDSTRDNTPQQEKPQSLGVENQSDQVGSQEGQEGLRRVVAPSRVEFHGGQSKVNVKNSQEEISYSASTTFRAEPASPEALQGLASTKPGEGGRSRAEVRTQIGDAENPITTQKEFADALLKAGIITQGDYDPRNITAALKRNITIFLEPGKSEDLTVGVALERLKAKKRQNQPPAQVQDNLLSVFEASVTTDQSGKRTVKSRVKADVLAGIISKDTTKVEEAGANLPILPPGVVFFLVQVREASSKGYALLTFDSRNNGINILYRLGGGMQSLGSGMVSDLSEISLIVSAILKKDLSSNFLTPPQKAFLEKLRTNGKQSSSTVESDEKNWSKMNEAIGVLQSLFDAGLDLPNWHSLFLSGDLKDAMARARELRNKIYTPVDKAQNDEFYGLLRRVQRKWMALEKAAGKPGVTPLPDWMLEKPTDARPELRAQMDEPAGSVASRGLEDLPFQVDLGLEEGRGKDGAYPVKEDYHQALLLKMLEDRAFLEESFQNIYKEIQGMKYADIKQVNARYFLGNGRKVLFRIKIQLKNGENRTFLFIATPSDTFSTQPSDHLARRYESISLREKDYNRRHGLSEDTLEFAHLFGTGRDIQYRTTSSKRYYVFSVDYHEGVILSDVADLVERIAGEPGKPGDEDQFDQITHEALEPLLAELIKLGALDREEAATILKAKERSKLEKQASMIAVNLLHERLFSLDQAAVEAHFLFMKKTFNAERGDFYYQSDPRRNNVIVRFVNGKPVFKFIDYDSMGLASLNNPRWAVNSFDIFEDKIPQSGILSFIPTVRPWFWTFDHDVDPGKEKFFEAALKGFGEKGPQLLLNTYNQLVSDGRIDEPIARYLHIFLLNKGILGALKSLPSPARLGPTTPIRPELRSAVEDAKEVLRLVRSARGNLEQASGVVDKSGDVSPWKQIWNPVDEAESNAGTFAGNPGDVDAWKGILGNLKLVQSFTSNFWSTPPNVKKVMLKVSPDDLAEYAVRLHKVRLATDDIDKAIKLLEENFARAENRTSQIEDQIALRATGQFLKSSLEGMGYGNLRFRGQTASGPIPIHDVDQADLPYPNGVNVGLFDAVQGLEAATLLSSKGDIQGANFLLIFPMGGVAYGKNNPDQVLAQYAIFIDRNGEIVLGRFQRPLPLHAMVYGGSYDSKVRKELDRKGIPLLNSPEATTLISSKDTFGNYLKQNKFPVPEFTVLEGKPNRQEVKDLIKKFMRSNPNPAGFVLKPTNATLGKGVKMFTEEEIESAVDHALGFLNEGNPMMLQKRISNRLFVDPETGQVMDWNLRVVSGWNGEQFNLTPEMIMVRYKPVDDKVGVEVSALKMTLKEFFDRLGFDSEARIQFFNAIKNTVEPIAHAVEQNWVDQKQYKHTGIVGWDLIMSESNQWYVMEANVGSLGSIPFLERSLPADEKGKIVIPLAQYLKQIAEKYREDHRDINTDESGDTVLADDPEIAFNHAWILNDSGEYAAAETAVRYALTLNPPPALAAYFWHNLGNYLVSQEKFEEAETAFRNAVDLDNTPAHQASLLEISLRNRAELRTTLPSNPEDAQEAFEVAKILGPALTEIQRQQERHPLYFRMTSGIQQGRLVFLIKSYKAGQFSSAVIAPADEGVLLTGLYYGVEGKVIKGVDPETRKVYLELDSKLYSIDTQANLQEEDSVPPGKEIRAARAEVRKASRTLGGQGVSRPQRLTRAEASRYYRRLLQTNPQDAESARKQLTRMSERQRFELMVMSAFGRTPTQAELQYIRDSELFKNAKIGVKRLQDFPGLDRLKKTYLPNVWAGYVKMTPRDLAFLREIGVLTGNAAGAHNLPGRLSDSLFGNAPNYFGRLGSFIYTEGFSATGEINYRDPLHETVHHLALGDQGRGREPFIDRHPIEVILLEELAAYRIMNLKEDGTIQQSFTPGQSSLVLMYVEDTVNLIGQFEDLDQNQRLELRQQISSLAVEAMESITRLDQMFPAVDVTFILQRARSLGEIVSYGRMARASRNELREMFRPGFTQNELDGFRKQGFQPGTWTGQDRTRRYVLGDGRALAMGLLDREARESKYLDLYLRGNPNANLFDLTEEEEFNVALTWAKPRVRWLFLKGQNQGMRLIERWMEDENPVFAEAAKTALEIVRAEVRGTTDEENVLFEEEFAPNKPLSDRTTPPVSKRDTNPEQEIVLDAGANLDTVKGFDQAALDYVEKHKDLIDADGLGVEPVFHPDGSSRGLTYQKLIAGIKQGKIRLVQKNKIKRFPHLEFVPEKLEPEEDFNLAPPEPDDSIVSYGLDDVQVEAEPPPQTKASARTQASPKPAKKKAVLSDEWIQAFIKSLKLPPSIEGQRERKAIKTALEKFRGQWKAIQKNVGPKRSAKLQKVIHTLMRSLQKGTLDADSFAKMLGRFYSLSFNPKGLGEFDKVLNLLNLLFKRANRTYTTDIISFALGEKQKTRDDKLLEEAAEEEIANAVTPPVKKVKQPVAEQKKAKPQPARSFTIPIAAILYPILGVGLAAFFILLGGLSMPLIGWGALTLGGAILALSIALISQSPQGKAISNKLELGLAPTLYWVSALGVMTGVFILLGGLTTPISLFTLGLLYIGPPVSYLLYDLFISKNKEIDTTPPNIQWLKDSIRLLSPGDTTAIVGALIVAGSLFVFLFTMSLPLLLTGGAIGTLVALFGLASLLYKGGLIDKDATKKVDTRSLLSRILLSPQSFTEGVAWMGLVIVVGGLVGGVLGFIFGGGVGVLTVLSIALSGAVVTLIGVFLNSLPTINLKALIPKNKPARAPTKKVLKRSPQSRSRPARSEVRAVDESKIYELIQDLLMLSSVDRGLPYDNGGQEAFQLFLHLRQQPHDATILNAAEQFLEAHRHFLELMKARTPAALNAPDRLSGVGKMLAQIERASPEATRLTLHLYDNEYQQVITQIPYSVMIDLLITKAPTLSFGFGSVKIPSGTARPSTWGQAYTLLLPSENSKRKQALRRLTEIFAVRWQQEIIRFLEETLILQGKMSGNPDDGFLFAATDMKLIISVKYQGNDLEISGLKPLIRPFTVSAENSSVLRTRLKERIEKESKPPPHRVFTLEENQAFAEKIAKEIRAIEPRAKPRDAYEIYVAPSDLVGIAPEEESMREAARDAVVRVYKKYGLPTTLAERDEVGRKASETGQVNRISDLTPLVVKALRAEVRAASEKELKRLLDKSAQAIRKKDFLSARGPLELFKSSLQREDFSNPLLRDLIFRGTSLSIAAGRLDWAAILIEGLRREVIKVKKISPDLLTRVEELETKRNVVQKMVRRIHTDFPGFELEGRLGGGTFSDVYLFRGPQGEKRALRMVGGVFDLNDPDYFGPAVGNFKNDIYSYQRAKKTGYFPEIYALYSVTGKTGRKVKIHKGQPARNVKVEIFGAWVQYVDGVVTPEAVLQGMAEDDLVKQFEQIALKFAELGLDLWDVVPANYLVISTAENRGQIAVVDFGAAKPFKTGLSKEQIEKRVQERVQGFQTALHEEAEALRSKTGRPEVREELPPSRPEVRSFEEKRIPQDLASHIPLEWLGAVQKEGFEYDRRQQINKIVMEGMRRFRDSHPRWTHAEANLEEARLKKLADSEVSAIDFYTLFVQEITQLWKQLSESDRQTILDFFSLLNFRARLLKTLKEEGQLLRETELWMDKNKLLQFLKNPGEAQIYLQNINNFIEKEIFRKEDIARLWWGNNPDWFFTVFGKKGYGEKGYLEQYLIFKGLIADGFLTYDDFLAEAALHISDIAKYEYLHKNFDYSRKASEEDQSAVADEVKAFFDVLDGPGQRTSFRNAFRQDAVGMINLIWGGKKDIGHYKVATFESRRDYKNYSFEAGAKSLPKLIQLVGRDNAQALFATNPRQFFNILAYLEKNLKDSTDVTGDFDRLFETIGNFTFKGNSAMRGLTPSGFLKEVLTNLVPQPAQGFSKPFGNEIEVMGSAVYDRFQMPSPSRQSGNPTVDDNAEKLIVFLMLMNNQIEDEVGRAMELVPPLFQHYRQAAQYLDHLEMLGLLSESPLDINIVLPSGIDLKILRRLQFPKHLLFTSVARLEQYGDIIVGGNLPSIRTKDDYRSMDAKPDLRETGGLERYEDRMNGIKDAEGKNSYLELLRYHQLLWEATMKASTIPELGLALEEYERALDTWFEKDVVDRLNLPAGVGQTSREWLISWLQEQPDEEYRRDESLGSMRQKLFAIDIGLHRLPDNKFPDNKVEFIIFKKSLTLEAREHLHSIIETTLNKLEPLLAVATQSTLRAEVRTDQEIPVVSNALNEEQIRKLIVEKLEEFETNLSNKTTLEEKLRYIIPYLLNKGEWMNVNNSLERQRVTKPDEIFNLEGSIAWALAWRSRMSLFGFFQDPQSGKEAIEKAAQIAGELDQQSGKKKLGYRSAVDSIRRAYWDEWHRRMSLNELELIAEFGQAFNTAAYTTFSPTGHYPASEKERLDAIRSPQGTSFEAILAFKVPSFRYEMSDYGVGALPHEGWESLPEGYAERTQIRAFGELQEAGELGALNANYIDIDASLEMNRVAFRQGQISGTNLARIEILLEKIRSGRPEPASQASQDLIPPKPDEGGLRRAEVRKETTVAPRRAENRLAVDNLTVDNLIGSLLPRPGEIVTRIKGSESVDVMIRDWEREARKDLEGSLREQLKESLKKVINIGVTLKTLEQLMAWIYSNGFEESIQNSLKPFIENSTLTSLDAQALAWRIRGVVTGEAALAVEAVDQKLAETIKEIEPTKLAEFRKELNQAIQALTTSGERQKKLMLVINYPDSEIVNKTLQKFSVLINRLVILYEKSQHINRSDWVGLPLSTEIIDPKNPGTVIGKVNHIGFGDTPSYALTNNIVPSQLLSNLISIRAQIDQLQDPVLQELAYQASVYLLFQLNNLPATKLEELKDAKAFRNFVEQQSPFLANSFAVGADGAVSLIVDGFLTDIAGIQAAKAAA